jgi:hypothetical protein
LDEKFSSRPMRFFLLVALVFFVPSSWGMRPLEHAQLMIYGLNYSMAAIAIKCDAVAPQSARQLRQSRELFQKTMQSDISAGALVGHRLAAGRGSFEEFMDAWVKSSLFKQGGNGPEADCTEFAQLAAERSRWRLDDFLAELFADWMKDVGNAQGFPCDWVPSAVVKLIEEFVDRELDFTDSKFADRLHVLVQVRRLNRYIVNCETVQRRAAEFRVTATIDFIGLGEALTLMESSLNAIGSDRESRLNATVRRLKDYPKRSHRP